LLGPQRPLGERGVDGVGDEEVDEEVDDGAMLDDDETLQVDE